MIRDREKLKIFERKVLRKMFRPIEDVGIYRIRTNYNLENLIQGASIVRFTKSQRMRWLDHLCRMEADRDTRRIMAWRPDEED